MPAAISVKHACAHVFETARLLLTY